MMQTTPGHIPETTLKPGDSCAGFLITRIRPAESAHALAIEARHKYTKAELFYLYSTDEENLFSVAFRTPPPDDTGVAHILEHSVLGGSRKYPVKEPFVEMLKMSMATFINAMTYPDKTVYPVASNVEQDFFNLMDVYCDAVLHPNITPVTLKQEGHHLAFAKPGDLDSPLTIRGIVYNEMKGAYSDLDSLIDRTSSQFLFPDTPYGRDSGGAPDEIPSLTYDRFKEFYDRYYHPANGKFFVHSCIPPEKVLKFLDERLAEAPPAPRDLDSTIPSQPRWPKPREETVEYPIAADERAEDRAAVTMNWLTGDISDPYSDLALEIVDGLLLGHASAPLRKALVDSQLGRDLTSSGYDNGRLETSFHVGLKGTRPEHKDDIVALIERTLEAVAKEGFSREQVERAVHQLEYSHREIQSHYPLRLMDWAYSAWLYDYDPLTYFETADQLEELMVRYDANPNCFSDLIRERLLENPHRVTVILKAAPGLQKQREHALQNKLEKVRMELDDDALRKIDREANALEKLQEKPNAPEDIAKLPQLELKDVPTEPRTIPIDLSDWQSTPPLISPDLATNNINYLMLAFDLEGLPSHLWIYVPLFSALLTRMGTKKHGYEVMSERIAENAGGLGAQTFVGTNALSPEKLMTYVSLGAKTLNHTLQPTLDIIEELLTDLDLNDHKHLFDLIKQTRERSLSNIIPGGHSFAAHHAARSHSRAAALADYFSGLPQVRLIDRLAKHFEEEVENLKGALEGIRSFLLSGTGIRASYTGPESQKKTIRNWLRKLTMESASKRGADQAPNVDWPALEPGPLREGLAMEADVAYCAITMPALHVSDPRSKVLQVLAHLLAFDYMWEEIRAKGGAYGGLCNYNASQSTLSLMSYRDPHIARTIEVCSRLPEYVRTHTWSHEDIERAVIGCARDHEKPVRPGWATGVALWRQLAGLTDEMRQEQRRRLLEVTPEQVHAVADEVFGNGFPQANICVLASRDKLEKEGEKLDEPLIIEPVIPA